MNIDNTVAYLQKIATLARESQSQGHIIGYPRYENEVYVLNDLHADDLEAASTKMLALLDRVEKAEGELDLMEQTLDLSKMVEDKVKKKLDWAEQELDRYDRRLEKTENEYNRLETSHSILEQALQRVRELHRRQPDTISGLDTGPAYCRCGEHYPCPTFQALDGAPEPEWEAVAEYGVKYAPTNNRASYKMRFGYESREDAEHSLGWLGRNQRRNPDRLMYREVRTGPWLPVEGESNDA